jgi:hypothetical protein
MAFLNTLGVRTWLGELLGRSGPISELTLGQYWEQGMPKGELGSMPLYSTEAVLEWLDKRARGGVAATTGVPETAPKPKRPRGRPRKHF